MGLLEYAKQELDYAFPGEQDSMQHLAMRNIMELIEKFCEQEHSGMSAPYVLGLFNRLVNWHPIKPLTGDEDEWGEAYGGDETQQNKRCSHVFRHHHNNLTAHDSHGKVFIDKDGRGYTCAESSVPVTFPYEVPDKPEYVHRDVD